MEHVRSLWLVVKFTSRFVVSITLGSCGVVSASALVSLDCASDNNDSVSAFVGFLVDFLVSMFVLCVAKGFLGLFG